MKTIIVLILLVVGVICYSQGNIIIGNATAADTNNLSLNASQLTSGTVPLAQLPTSIWTNVITTNVVSFTNIFRFDGTNAWLTMQSTNGTSQPLLYTVTNNQVLFTGNGLGVSNLNASQLLSGTVPIAQIPAGVAQTSLRNIFTVPQAITASDGTGSGLILATNTASSSFIAVMTLLGLNLTSGQEIFYRFGKDATLNTNAASIGFTWVGNGSALNSMDFSFTGLGRFMQLFGDGHVNANGSGITNLVSSNQAGQTNVALVAATAFTVTLGTGFASTNWIPTLVEAGGLPIPGLTGLTVTSTNQFTSAMSAFTFTGKLWFTGTAMTQNQNQ